MKRRTTRPLLFGPNGKPLAGFLYPSPALAPHHFRRRSYLNRDTQANVTDYDRAEMIDLSRQLYSQVSNLGSAINEKNRWAFLDGWEPTYTGVNTAWGDAAERFLREQYLPNIDVHGQFDWNTLLMLSGIAWDRDGDDLMIPTEDRSGSGFPKVDIIPATRIANSKADVEGYRVTKGPYAGKRIQNGIIFDGNTPIAARVIGANPTGTGQEETYEDFPLNSADLAFLPEWRDQGRGLPLIGRPMFDWIDVQEVDTFLKRGLKRKAAVGLIQKNEEGEPQLGNMVTTEAATDTAGGTHEITYEEIEGGEIYWLKSQGEEMTELKFDSPHPNVEAFIARIERRGLKAIGWSYELVYLAESGRAATRLVCKLGNNSIWAQQKVATRRTWRAIRYGLAKGMKYGFLPRNSDPRDAYFNWELSFPQELSVDQGNDEQSARENIKMGLSTQSIEVGKKGYHQRDIKRQRRNEIIANDAEAQAIVSATSGRIPYEKALDLLEQRSANPTAQATPEPEEPAANPNPTR